MRLVRELGIDEEFLHSRPVRRVVNSAGPHAVPHGERNLVLLHNLKEVIELSVKGVLFLVVEHPCGHECAATGYEPGMTALVLQALDGLPVDAGMDSHEVGAELSLLSGDSEEIILLHVYHSAVPDGCFDECLVERDTADREARVCDDLSPYLLEIAAGRELHQGISASQLGLPGLLDFHGNINDIGRGADGSIHLGPQSFADPADLHLAIWRDRDDNVSPGNPAPYKVFRDTFLLCNNLHLFGDDALFGICNNTHIITVYGKDQIKARFFDSGRNLAC